MTPDEEWHAKAPAIRIFFEGLRFNELAKARQIVTEIMEFRIAEAHLEALSRIAAEEKEFQRLMESYKNDR